MDFDLAARTAVVIRGQPGIGLAVVRLLAATAPSPPTCGWAATASPRPSARPPEQRLTTSRASAAQSASGRSLSVQICIGAAVVGAGTDALVSRVSEVEVPDMADSP